MSDPPDSSFDQTDMRVFIVPDDRILPAICPQCGAPGTASHALAAPAQAQDSTTTPLEVYLCDLCAQHLARTQTVQVAWALFGTLVGASLASTLTFYWGERLLFTQLLLLTLAGCLLSGLSWHLSKARLLPLFELNAPKANGIRYLYVPRSAYSQKLREDEFEELSRAQFSDLGGHLPVPLEEQRGKIRWLILSPLLLSVLWWTGLQAFGQATVRAVNMGPDPVTVMIDDRRVLVLHPTQFEQAELGGKFRVLAGPRKLTLVAADGALLFSDTLFIAPGATALLTRLLPQFCIYQEERDYSKLNVPSRLSILFNGTGAFALKSPADSWFAPLYVAKSTTEQEQDAKMVGAAGVRRAVRLLECP